MGKIQIIVGVIAVALCITLAAVTDHNHKADITTEINQSNYQVIDISYKTVFSRHPFHWVNSKSDWIYKVTYQDGSEEKTAWVLYRGFGKAKWDWGNDPV